MDMGRVTWRLKFTTVTIFFSCTREHFFPVSFWSQSWLIYVYNLFEIRMDPWMCLWKWSVGVGRWQTDCQITSFGYWTYLSFYGFCGVVRRNFIEIFLTFYGFLFLELESVTRHAWCWIITTHFQIDAKKYEK